MGAREGSSPKSRPPLFSPGPQLTRWRCVTSVGGPGSGGSEVA